MSSKNCFNKLRKKLNMLIGFVMLLLGYILLYYAKKIEICGYISIILGLIAVFYKQLDSFNMLGLLTLKINQAKNEIDLESEKLILRQLLRSIALDCAGQTKSEIIDFLTSTKNIDLTLKINQTDDYSLNELCRDGFITYKELPEKVANMIESKNVYEITLKKVIHIK